jgi:hypothetical protein
LKKIFLTLIALFVCTSAFAAEVQVPCSSDDYRTLYLVLGPESSATVIKGSQFKSELYSVLQQEMGPVCVTYVQTKPRIGISGDKTRRYEITDAVAKYTVVYRTSVERRRNDLAISRKMLKR